MSRRIIENIKSGLRFDGNGVVVTTGMPSSYADMTISIVLKQDARVAANTGIFFHFGSDYQKGFAFQVDQNGNLTLQYRDSTPTNTSHAVPGEGYKPGRFITFDAVYDSAASEIRIYRNSILIDSFAFSDTITPSNTSMYYGGDNFYSGHRLKGVIDSVRVWSDPLTHEQLVNKYVNGVIPTDNLEVEHKLNEGSGLVATDSSGNSRDGTIPSALTWVGESPSNQRA